MEIQKRVKEMMSMSYSIDKENSTIRRIQPVEETSVWASVLKIVSILAQALVEYVGEGMQALKDGVSPQPAVNPIETKCIEAKIPIETKKPPAPRRLLSKEQHLDLKDTIKRLRAQLNSSTMWLEPNTSKIQVRGLKYMHDKKKIPAGPKMGVLIHIDLINLSGDRVDHIAKLEQQRQHSILKTFENKHPDMNVFIVNFQLPGSPLMSVVGYWAIPQSTESKFQKLYSKFLNDKSDTFRRSRLKIIPSIVSGPWIATTTIPNRPAITGTKFTHRYFRGKNYMEVDMDLSSSAVASRIVSLCRGYASKLVIDLSFTLQGESGAELPEKIFASARFDHFDLKNATTLAAFNHEDMSNSSEPII